MNPTRRTTVGSRQTRKTLSTKGESTVVCEELKEPHRRTRKDHSTETAEDYVEAVAEIQARTGLCRVVDLAQRFDVSHVTVTRIVSRLKKEGYVDTEPYRPISLTEKGALLAEESQKRHDLVYRFLLAIGVPEKIAAIDAEGIEHHVSPETLERFEKIAAQTARGKRPRKPAPPQK